MKPHRLSVSGAAFSLVDWTASVIIHACLKHLSLAGQWTNQNPQGLCMKQPLIPNPDPWFIILHIDWSLGDYLTGICIPLPCQQLAQLDFASVWLKKKKKTRLHEQFHSLIWYRHCQTKYPELAKYPITQWSRHLIKARLSPFLVGVFPSWLQRLLINWGQPYSKLNHPTLFFPRLPLLIVMFLNYASLQPCGSWRP